MDEHQSGEKVQKNQKFISKTQQLTSIANLSFGTGLEAAIHLMKIPSENRTTQENSYIGLYLPKVEYFKNLLQKYGQASFDHVCRDIQARTYQKGEAVFHQGDKGEEFYIILTGTVGVYIQKSSDDPNDTTSYIPREVSVLKVGDSFGELALIKGKNGTRGASIYAKEKADLAFFTANVFNKLLLEKEKDRFDVNLKFLSEIEVFKESEEEVTRNVFMYSKIKQVVNCQIIYDIEDASELFFIIKDGTYLVQKPALIGNKFVLVKICSLFTGEIFGHEDIIYDQPRQTQVKCISSQGELFVMTKLDFMNRLWNISESFVTRLTALTRQRMLQQDQRVRQADSFAQLVIQQEIRQSGSRQQTTRHYTRSNDHIKHLSSPLKQNTQSPNHKLKSYLISSKKQSPSRKENYFSLLERKKKETEQMEKEVMENDIAHEYNYNFFSSTSRHQKKNTEENKHPTEHSEAHLPPVLPSQVKLTKELKELRHLTQRLARFKQVVQLGKAPTLETVAVAPISSRSQVLQQFFKYQLNLEGEKSQQKLKNRYVL